VALFSHEYNLRRHRAVVHCNDQPSPLVLYLLPPSPRASRTSSDLNVRLRLCLPNLSEMLRLFTLLFSAACVVAQNTITTTNE
jgi:hypothetical protein